MEIHIVIAHACHPAEGNGVQPDVAVGHLHTFGATGSSRGVVDGSGSVFVRLPEAGIGIGNKESFVALGAKSETMRASDVGHSIG